MDFPLLAGPTPPAQQIASTREGELLKPFFDIIKYVILPCAFMVFLNLLGYKIRPGCDETIWVGSFLAFFRPSRVLDKKMNLPRPTLGPRGAFWITK